MKYAIQSGDILDLVAPSGGVVSGTGYQIGQVVAVAQASVAAAAIFAGVVRGVVTAAKATGQSWTQGAALYFDAAANKFTTVATGNRLSGAAGAAADTNDATGLVYLDGAVRLDEAT